MSEPAPASSRPTTPRMMGGAIWLALGLSLAYLVLMAGLVWWFDGTLTLQDASEAPIELRREHLWTLIGVSAALVFAIMFWSLRRGGVHSVRAEAERDALLQRVQDLAYYDSLTGLPRRPLTEDRLQVAVAQAKRDNGSVGVLFIDLDGFKAINDRHGHAAGDELLQFVADQLSGRLREGDTVGRIGGDEFLVVLPGCGDAAALARLGETFARAAKASFDWEGQRLSVGASVGGALHPHHGDDAAALTAAADKAMYRARQAGGGYASA